MQSSSKILGKIQAKFLGQLDPGFVCANIFDNFDVFYDTLVRTFYNYKPHVMNDCKFHNRIQLKNLTLILARVLKFFLG